MRKWFRSVVFLLLVLLAVACTMPQAQDVQAATLRLNKVKVTLVKGGQVKLKVTGTKKKPKWSTDKKKVATVTDKGLVKAKGKGTARVTAKVGKKKLVCRVTVETPKLNKSNLTLDVGKTVSLKVTGTKSKVRWYTTDRNIATVTQKGVVRGVRTGSCQVYAKVNGGKFYCAVIVRTAPQISLIPTSTPRPTSIPTQTPTVSPAPEPKLELNLSSEYQTVKVNKDGSLFEDCKIKIESVLFDGEDITGKLTYPTHTAMPAPPGDTSPKELLIGFTLSYGVKGEWNGSTREYIVNSFTPYSEEHTTGYVDAKVIYGSYVATKRFVIEKDPDYVQIIPVEGFRFAQETLHIYEGESKKLNYSITPEDATDKTVSFSSSDEKIAIVGDGGTVEGKIPGECTITAVCGGFEASCEVIVDKKFVVEDAKKALTYESYIMENPKDGGVVVIAKNNYKYAMHIDAKCRFYDDSGSLIGDSGTLSEENYCLEPGKESFFYIKGPYNPSKYEVYFEVRESYYEGLIEGIKILSSDKEFHPNSMSSISVNVKNESSINSFTKIACIFYKNGLPVGFGSNYANVKYIGAEDKVNLYCNAQDLDGHWIEPDDFKLNTQYSYKTLN